MAHGIRYRVQRRIARGGMAEIFLATQIGLEGFEKPVVLKRILPALAAEPGFLRMLLDEAQIVSRLNHTNLVQVLDLWRADGQFFLVLEFVDGWSLEEVRVRAAKARLKLPLHLALSITASLCRALHYVHRHTRDGEPLGIVHRDVTPQNVLLSREGDVKLADFGVAKATGRREKSAVGVIKGKFAYMSPEQSIGAELDSRSDLFSVGSLLYVLTTGHKPFNGKTDIDTLMQVRRARHQKPSAHVRDFNPDVERFIERALRADRARRWQSAEQMADRLDTILVKLGQPSGPAALKRWLATLTARDGVLSPGDLSDPAREPSTRLVASSDDLSLQSVAPAKASTDVEQEEVATIALAVAVAETTQALSEGDLEAAASEGLDTAAAAPGNATVALDASELHEHTPPAPALTIAESGRAPAGARARYTSIPPLPAIPQPPPSLTLLEEPAQATLPQSPSDVGPAISEDTELAEFARRARGGPLAGVMSALRRTVLAAVVLSLLLGSGLYVARPFLPDWIASTTFAKWIDSLFDQLPRPRYGHGDHSSLAPLGSGIVGALEGASSSVPTRGPCS